jgi:L-ascorbate metabolism protein UlaG (beta-lactamase superfamily)
MNDESRREPRVADRRGDAAGESSPHGASRIDGRFANADPHPSIGAGFWRWQRERRAAGLPHAPAEGYAAFAERWRTIPDFRCGLGEAHVAARPCVWWLGHATVLLRIGGLHVITDPHLGRRASPLPFAGPVRRVAVPARADELPSIDAVLISHNHYDHLDAASVRAILRSHPHATFYVPLGLGSWMRRRGVSRVHELDWWERREHEGLEVHCVPAQHWSARWLLDRNRTLWCGWFLRTQGFSFWFAGDTGWTPRLATIAERLGSPDLAALPIGSYEPRWFMRPQHIDPPEAVRVHEELAIARSLAIHWGTFELADDSLDEPASSLRNALALRGLTDDEFWLLRQGEGRKA